nr:Fic family protein [Pseudaestuariivita rosea]
MVQTRVLEGPPGGNFDAGHIKSIHKHLFQDVYEWAGQYRQVEIGKGGRWFHQHALIDKGMADVERTMQAGNFGRGLDASDYSEFAAKAISDLNYVHPFREGNGRTQTEFLKQMTERAGHEFHTERIQRDAWILASQVSHSGTNDLLRAAITHAIDPDGRETGRKAQEAVAKYFETVTTAIDNLRSPTQRAAALDQVRSVAKAYETIMDRDTLQKVLKESRGRER